jgi:streptogramin lyase
MKRFLSAVVLVMGCGNGGGNPAVDMAAPADLAQPPAPDLSVSQLALPGDTFYPESLNAAADGTLFVGSLATGAVVKIAPGSSTPVQFLAGGDPKGVTGVLPDSPSSTLYLCAVDLSKMVPTSEVRAYDLGNATLKATWPFPNAAFCNDLALDGAGNLFVSDSFGSVYRLAKGAMALVQWSADPLLAASMMGGFGADGIALDGKGNLYVNTFTGGHLVRIPIQQDGSAGTAVSITVTPALQTPDGMRMLDANTLILADGTAGQITKVAISGTNGTATVAGTGLNGPTGVVKVGSTYWVSEGQLGHLTGQIAGPPSLPFLVRGLPAS